MTNQTDIAIIGSGIGGLSAGALLAQKGYNVVIFERLGKPGGYAQTFKRKGYTFEATTHQLSGFNVPMYLQDCVKILGIQKDIAFKQSSHCFESVLFNSENLAVCHRRPLKAGVRNARKDLYAYFPEDRALIDTVLERLSAIGTEALRLKRIMREGAFPHLYDAITALMLKNAPPGSLSKKIGAHSYPHLAKYRHASFADIICDVENPELKHLLTQYCAYLALPSNKADGIVAATMLYLYILQGPVALEGGSAGLTALLINRINENGGSIRCHSAVKRIIFEDGVANGVQLEDGTEYKSRFVISDSSAYETFNQLLKRECIKDDAFGKTVDAYKSSSSTFQTYLGLPFDIRSYGYDCATTIFSSDINMDNALDTLSMPTRQSPFVLTNYAIANPQWFDGNRCSVVICEFDTLARWKHLNADAYAEQKEDVQSKIIQKVKTITGIPLDEAEVCFSATPKTMAYYSGEPFGGMMGADTDTTLGGFNRWGFATPVRNLYMVGADSAPAGGISSCLDSGVVTGQMILRSHL